MAISEVVLSVDSLSTLLEIFSMPFHYSFCLPSNIEYYSIVLLCNFVKITEQEV
jgi:hypothetical protein